MSEHKETLRHEVWLSSLDNRRKIQELMKKTGMSKSEILRRLLDGMTLDEIAAKVLPDFNVQSKHK